MDQYKTVKECDNCASINLNYNAFACGRYLCVDCEEKVECPCDKCNIELPKFCKKCPICAVEMNLNEQDKLVCMGCHLGSLETASIYDLFTILLGKIFLCKIPNLSLLEDDVKLKPCPKFSTSVSVIKSEKPVSVIKCTISSIPKNGSHPAILSSKETKKYRSEFLTLRT